MNNFCFGNGLNDRYLLEESGEIGGEADGSVDEQVVEVALLNKQIEVGDKEVVEVDSVDCGIEALSEGFGVVLQAGNSSKEE